MSTMYIDGVKCSIGDESNILELALNNGIDIPNLCYCDSLAPYGGCRLCIVEDERGAIVTACTVKPKEDMRIRTNTAKLREYRRSIIELMLESHQTECNSCKKCGRCKLQAYAKRFGAKAGAPADWNPGPVDDSSPSIIRDPSKCILCAKCVRVCKNIQDVAAIDLAWRGANAAVTCGFGMKLADTDCVGCGQCAAVCPTGAITVKDDTRRFWDALLDPDKKVYVQVAPAVRVGLAEEFEIPSVQSVGGKVVSALRLMGADKVYSTADSAFLTLEEESRELSERMKSGKKLPMFSSYCPAWVHHVENKHPKLMPELSAAASPMAILGGLIRKQFPEENAVSVAVMSCTAAKAEALRPELTKNGRKLVDIVISTQELAAMIREYGIKLQSLPDTEPDKFFERVSGDGELKPAVTLTIDPNKCIGCTKCARSCPVSAISGSPKKAHSIDPEKCIRCRTCKVGCPAGAISDTTGFDGELRIAVANGLANADGLLKKIADGEASYDFVEVMACPNGCIGGGGQPESCGSVKAMRKLELDPDLLPSAIELDCKDGLCSVREILGDVRDEILRAR